MSYNENKYQTPGAVAALKRFAESGNAESQYRLGNAYNEGNGVDWDAEEAVKWYRLAAEQGHVEAQFTLALCYHQGYGVAKNPEEVVRWCRLAVGQGHIGAQYRLGLCYRDGCGVEQDREQALAWLRLAAEQGHERAKEAAEAVGTEQQTFRSRRKKTDPDKLNEGLQAMLDEAAAANSPEAQAKVEETKKKMNRFLMEGKRAIIKGEKRAAEEARDRAARR